MRLVNKKYFNTIKSGRFDVLMAKEKYQSLQQDKISAGLGMCLSNSAVLGAGARDLS